MAAFDYAEFSALALEMLEEAGRDISLYKLSSTPANPLKPWRGTGTPGPTKTSRVDTKGVFAVPNTSIPTESRGLGFDWIDQDLLKRTRHVCIVPASGLPALESYNVLVDGFLEFKVIWGQCLQPGPTRLLYVFGLAQ